MIFILASWIGTFAFALSGFLVGARKSLDLMGVFILAFLTANGGGMVRDVFIGKTPLALTDLTGLIIVLLAFLIGLILYKLKKIDVETRKLFVLSDSIGLAAFSLTGALAGIDAGLSIFGVVVLSFITATGGGIIRDMMVNDVPSVFRSDFYGSVAILVALALYGLDSYGFSEEIYTLSVFISALIIRLIAFKLKWHLPSLKL